MSLTRGQVGAGGDLGGARGVRAFGGGQAQALQRVELGQAGEGHKVGERGGVQHDEVEPEN